MIILRDPETKAEVVAHCDKITADTKIVFLNASKKYDIKNIQKTDVLEIVVVFIPYGKDFLHHRALAKQMRLNYYGKQIFLIDTNFTYQVSQGCRLEYDEYPSTEVLTMAYLIAEDIRFKITDDIKPDENEQEYFEELCLQSQTSRSNIPAENLT